MIIQSHLIDWETLDAKRIYIKNSFDFTVKSIYVFDNIEIILKSIKILIKKLLNLKKYF